MGRNNDDGCILLIGLLAVAFFIGRCTADVPQSRQPARFTSMPPPSGYSYDRRTYYANCSDARADGVAPIYEGEDGYASHLDRDGDGIACE